MELHEPEKKQGRTPGQARPRRKSAVYDSDGNEVLVTLMCLKCRKVKPLAQFGLRKMADGAIRNQPWCRPCRSAASTKKPKGAELTEVPAAAPEASGSSVMETPIEPTTLVAVELAPVPL